METYILNYIFILFFLCFTVQLYFIGYKQGALTRYNAVNDLPEVNLPVSVIISARNEAENLLENLPLILQQNYPDFEVIVINDCSSDLSANILLELKESYPHLKIVTVLINDRYFTGKKFALTLGIKAAKNEYLIFTDADCRPTSPNWIMRMAANFNEQVSMVLGYSPYQKVNNLVNPLIRYETIKTAINYFSAVLRGNTYMGVGRNLAYTKTLFFNSKGFASHMHILSGDDDIFVNQNATQTNTAIEIHPESFMYSKPKTSLAAWFRQKKRHFGAGGSYKLRHIYMLSLEAVSGILFYVSLALCLIFNFEPLIVAGLFIFRLIFQLLTYRKLFRQFDGKYLLFFLPVLDMVYYIYLNVFGLIGRFTKSTQWK